MECDEEVDGCPCINITEEKAPSIFNEYYAKTFFLQYVNLVILYINLIRMAMINIRTRFQVSRKCSVC